VVFRVEQWNSGTVFYCSYTSYGHLPLHPPPWSGSVGRGVCIEVCGKGAELGWGPLWTKLP
jgi:hypothetical protein